MTRTSWGLAFAVVLWTVACGRSSAPVADPAKPAAGPKEPQGPKDQKQPPQKQPTHPPVQSSDSVGEPAGAYAYPEDVAPLAASEGAFAAVDAKILEQMRANHVAGLSAAIVRGGQVLWANSYGYADVAKKVKVTPKTRFAIGSISKVVTAVAALQMVEAGKLSLDADLGAHNPKFSSDAVTLRHLLTHTSSLIRDAELADYTVPLKSAIEEVLPKASSWQPRKPGAQYEYSNLGAAYVGYLVEQKAGVAFEEYVTENVFGRLGMTLSRPRYAEYDGEAAAMPYAWKSGKLEAYPLADQWDSFHPCGEMLSTPSEVGLLMNALASQGAVGSKRILSAESTAEMLKRQIPDSDEVENQGLILYGQYVGEELMLGHGGNIFGSSSDARWRASDGTAAVVLVNADGIEESAAGIVPMLGVIEAELLSKL